MRGITWVACGELRVAGGQGRSCCAHCRTGLSGGRPGGELEGGTISRWSGVVTCSGKGAGGCGDGRQHGTRYRQYCQSAASFGSIASVFDLPILSCDLSSSLGGDSAPQRLRHPWPAPLPHGSRPGNLDMDTEPSAESSAASGPRAAPGQPPPTRSFLPGFADERNRALDAEVRVSSKERER